MARRALESLGRLVREKRGDKKLRDIATETGVSAPTLMRIEAGRTPDIQTFGKICTWLGIDPAEFIGGASSQPAAAREPARTEVAIHMKADKAPDANTLRALSEMISLVAGMQAPSNLE